jgi:glycosyltransferase involved in cell wall biosynthesis
MTVPAGSPTVSVVVTTYNRRDRLAEVLEPLLADPDALEVLVVVDGCRDGSLELLERLALREPKLRPLMPERNLGQPRARLYGVQHARGDVILSLDDDVVAAPGLVGGHRRHHVTRAHGVVLGYMPTETPSRRRPGQFATLEYAQHYEEHCERYERDPGQVLTNLWGGNFSVRRDDFLAAVNGYHFPLRYHEDQDLGLRLRRLGVEPVFDRSLRARHRHERTFDSYLRESHSAGLASCLLPDMHPDVLEPYHPDDALPHYSLPARVILPWTDVPWARRLVMAGLRQAVTIAGRARLFSLESKLAAVARHVVERQGAFLALASAAGDHQSHGTGPQRRQSLA